MGGGEEREGGGWMRRVECLARSWWIWAEMVLGRGGMDGLMKGHVMVEWEMDRQTAHVMLRQPKNTLLCSSVSRAPQ